MKNTLFIILLFIASNILAQDTIKTKDGEMIQVKEIRISPNNISYKLYGNPDSSRHKILKKDVQKITYENGKEKIFYSPNPRKDFPLGINFVVGGPTGLLSLSVDYFIVPSFNVNAGFGVFGYYGGIKYHFGGNVERKNWTPYVGLSVTRIVMFGFFNIDQTGLYIPIGIHYIATRDFSFGVETAAFFIEGTKTNTPPPVWGAIRLGYHF